MAAVTIHPAVATVYRLFDGDVPKGFSFNGQTFAERCEAWVLHAVEQLEDEIKAFKDEGESAGDDEEEDEE